MKKNMMRNLKKRALALVLCFAMVLNTGVTTFAEENQGTVPEVENTEYKCGFEAHEHEDTCYSKELLCEENADPVLTCVIETHEHEAACYEEPVLKCEKTEHKHGDACYTAHVHGEGCYTVACAESTEPVLACTTEAYAHTDSCYTAHVHGEGCYEDKLTCTVVDCTHEDVGCYTSVVTCTESTDQILVCEKTEHEHGEACYTAHEHGDGCYTVTCTESTEPVLTCIIDEYIHSEACYEEPVLKCEKTEHVHDEETCYFVEHVHEDKCYTEPILICEKPVHIHTDECKGSKPVLLMNLLEDDTALALIGEEEYDTLEAAIEAAHEDTTSSVVEITLLKNCEFNKAYTIERNITINGNGYTLTRANAYAGSVDKGLFTVNAGVTLTLNNVTIDGNNNWTFDEAAYRAAVENGSRVNQEQVKYAMYEKGKPIAQAYLITIKGQLILDGGTKIENHVGCPLFYVEKDGSLHTKQATITHNTRFGSPVVASIAGDGNWTIDEGTAITDNHCGQGNGNISYMCGTTTMNGGVISRNTGVDCNGGVMMLYGGKAHFIMNDGTISDNGALYGNSNGWNPAFYVYGNGSKFTMNGGQIVGNYSSTIPGIANNGSNARITLNGGKIINTISGRGYIQKDVYAYCPVDISETVNSETNRFLNDVTNTGVLNGNAWFYSNEMSYSGNGTINGNVTIQSGAETTMENGTWNGFVTVKAIGNDTTLTVKNDAVIIGDQVRVLNSVESGNSANTEESAAAHAAAYVQEDGATVNAPVLYYHRLTSAQEKTVVVTYDYNGGLDAQNWSGIQRTGTAPYTLEELPVPTREGHVLTGWNYATDTKPESLDMSGDTPYVAGTVANESLRLVAQWKAIDYVCFIDADEDGVWDETEIRYETLAEAVDVANKSENAVSIVMIKDINYDDDYKAYYKVEDKKINALNIGSKGSIRNITISGEHKIFRGSYPGTMLKVNEGSTLTLDGKLTLDGNNNWTFGEAEKQLYNERLMGGIKAVDAWYDYAKSAPNGTKATGFMITTESGTVNLNKVTIQNNYGDNAGIVKTLKAGSKVNLTGATIQHVATPRGNGLAVFSEQVNEINVNDGTLITGNHVGSNHGIFKVYSGTVIKMTGGTISHNTGYDSNGVVIGMWGSGSSFYMTGGTISHNSSTRGSSNGYNAAVYLHYNSYMKMTGGEISNNIGYLRGGIDNKYNQPASLDINRVDQVFVDGVYANENGKDAYVKEHHPVVIDNISVGGNPQYDVGRGPDLNKWWITGGIYTQDVDEFCAKGYVCIPYEDTKRTDDYIVVPGYRVRYHAVEKIVTREPATGEETTTYNTTLVHKEFHIVPRDEFWYEMDEKAQYVSYTDEETGKTIDTWYREKELQNEYKFNETKLIDNLDVYGKYNPRYGYVVIEKNLENYNKTMKGSTFVYEVTAEKYGDPTYKFNEVVAIEMDGTSGKYVKVGPILEEAEVTVTEIYSGAGYTKAEQPQKKTVVFNEAWNEWYKNPNPAAGKTILNGISLDDSTEKENETYVKVVFTGGYIPGRINYGTSVMAIFKKKMKTKGGMEL